jgi:hypothetical protein
MPGQKLVIGIDYGTSNSGVAYTILDDEIEDDHPEIEVIRKWPQGSLKRDASDKVPSQIAYNSSGKPVAYGFEIPDGTHALQWVKLLLEPDHFIRGPEKTPHPDRVWKTYKELDELGKRPQQVITDYLAWLWQRTVNHIIETEDDKDIFKTAAVTVVMTVPASWSDRAKESMIRAAKSSGIDAPGRKLKFRAEPEAAGIFELKQKAKRRQVATGDCVIVCDAGGGTVDVVTYQIRTRNPLTLDQVVLSKGDFCGSAFVDLEFERQLRFMLPGFDNLAADALAQLRDHFEYKIKRRYNPEEPKTYGVPVTGLADDPAKGTRDGVLQLEDAVLQASFGSIIDQTMALIDHQREELKAKRLDDKLKGIVTVGGFGGSEYLHTRIRQEFPEDEGIKVWRGDQSWTAVVQGAVVCEASSQTHQETVKTRLSNYNYGITYRQEGLRKVQWLVRKGQELRSNTQNEPFFLCMEDQRWLDEDEYVRILVSLVKSDKDTVKDELDMSIRPHLEISCRVPTGIRKTPDATLVPGNPGVWKIPAQLELVLDGAVLSVRCRIQGEEVGAVGLKYEEEPDEHVLRSESIASSSTSTSSRPSVTGLEAREDSFISTTPQTPISPSQGKRPSFGMAFRKSFTWGERDAIRTKREKPEKKPKSPKSGPAPPEMVFIDGRLVPAPKDPRPSAPGLF